MNDPILKLITDWLAWAKRQTKLTPKHVKLRERLEQFLKEAEK